MRLQVEDAFARLQVEACVEITAPGAITAAIVGRSADFDVVVIGGGDGSVGAAAAALAGSETPLGILPLGTFNHFAKDLGLPTDLAGAAKVIAQAKIRAVDVGEINGHVFVNAASLGIYPYLAAARGHHPWGRHRGLARIWALLSTLARLLWRLPRPRLRLVLPEVDGWRKTPCLFIGNNLYALDPFASAWRSRLDGGELGIYLVNSERRFTLLSLVCRAALGRLDPGLDLTLIRAEAVTIRAKRRIRVALDGETLKLRAPLHCRIRPHALRVLVKQ